METVAFELDLTLAYQVIGALVLGASMGVLFQPFWPDSEGLGRVAWVFVVIGLSRLLFDTQGLLSCVVLAVSIAATTTIVRALRRRRERRDGGDPSQA